MSSKYGTSHDMGLDAEIEVCPKCGQAVLDGLVWVDDQDFARGGVLAQATARRVCKQCVRGLKLR